MLPLHTKGIKITQETLELAEKKCNCSTWVFKITPEKILAAKTDEDSRLNAEKEAKANLKIVEKEEKRAGEAVGKDEEKSSRKQS